MKIKLVTLFDEKFNAIGALSSRVMAEYCHKRGYQFVCYNHLPDKSRGAQWNKTRIVQQELHDCDWLMWMDADSLPVNHDFSIEKMIGQIPDKDLIISGDDGGLCFGIFAIRNCSWSVQFLQTLWFCGQMQYDYAKRYCESPQFDQVTVKALADNFPAIAGRIAVIGQDWVAYPRSEFSRENFAVHYWSSDNSHAGIVRRMGNYIENGWSQAAHQELKIVTSSNAAMSSILKISMTRNKAAGYDTCVYDINGELGFGTRFDTDHKFGSSRERFKGRLPFKPAVIRAALTQHRQFIAYMDADAFAIRRFDEINTDDYDVGVTMRRPEERGATQWPALYGFLNAGVMFFNHTPAAFKFIDIWEAELNNSSSASDQEALNMVVLQATDLTEYDKIFYWKGIRIKIFRTDDYNFYYWPQEPLPKTRILHAKTDKRLALDDWGHRDWQL